MARYRVKDDTDLRWNRIRRMLTRDLDSQIQNTREDMLNTILADAWTKYAESLESGTKLEIEDRYTEFVDSVLRREVRMAIGVNPESSPSSTTTDDDGCAFGPR